MSTDKPTVEEIREWQNQNHRYALRHHYDVKAIDFLLAEIERLKAMKTEPVATLPACLCGLDTNPVASPRMDIHCPKHDVPEAAGEPSDEEFNPWYENYEKALVAEVLSPTPADEEVAREVVRGWTCSLPLGDITGRHYADLTTRISTALAEARRAGTPTADVRERAKAIVSRFNIDSCDWTDHPTTELINAIASAISSTPSEQGTCTWTCEPNPDIEMWKTNCGNAFQFEVGGPTENKMKFCCYCGKRLAEKVAEEREEGEGDG